MAAGTAGATASIEAAYFSCAIGATGHVAFIGEGIAQRVVDRVVAIQARAAGTAATVVTAGLSVAVGHTKRIGLCRIRRWCVGVDGVGVHYACVRRGRLIGIGVPINGAFCRATQREKSDHNPHESQPGGFASDEVLYVFEWHHIFFSLGLFGANPTKKANKPLWVTQIHE